MILIKSFPTKNLCYREKLKELILKNKKDTMLDNNANAKEEKILRVITKNDVRARILRIPNEIFEKYV